MNIKLGMIAACVLATGCVVAGGTPGDPAGAPTTAAIDTPAPAPDLFPSMTQPDGVPRIVMPATGGMPVIGIPLGGNMFQPVTGGTPVFGIPTSP